MKTFALIGAAGYVAPRHMRAIKDTDNRLIAAVDKHDSVGILDAYFPEASFFTEFERFDRHLEKKKQTGHPVEYVSICSPNYLHDAHIRFGLRYGADLICEKPTVLNPWNVDSLQLMEEESENKVFNILQLRLHDKIAALKNQVEAAPPGKIYDIDLTYITPRGNWYYASWKGDPEKSGGIATNIGIHFFDMLAWIFGPLTHSEVHLHTHDRAGGYFEFSKARVRWFLSINADTLTPQTNAAWGLRSMTIDGGIIDFSDGFADLHTESYKHILSGAGFRLSDVRPAIEMVHRIRSAKPIGLKGNYHPLCQLPASSHPFKM